MPIETEVGWATYWAPGLPRGWDPRRRFLTGFGGVRNYSISSRLLLCSCVGSLEGQMLDRLRQFAALETVDGKA
jgi:hypothetical protein